jgi:hypothetical protein
LVIISIGSITVCLTHCYGVSSLSRGNVFRYHESAIIEVSGLRL